MKRGRAEAIIADIQEAVTHWEGYADASGVNPNHRNRIWATMQLQPFAS